MPYYQAGGYAYAAGGMGNYQAGGIFSFLGKAVKSVAKVGGALLTGGPIAAAGAALREIAPTPAANSPIPIMQPPAGLTGLSQLQVPTPKQQSQGVSAVGVSPLGTIGVAFRKHRHMNAGNAKAARRAIRRIKAVRHLLVGIERELPRRPAVRHHGSPGVITRGEARRALSA